MPPSSEAKAEGTITLTLTSSILRGKDLMYCVSDVRCWASIWVLNVVLAYVYIRVPIARHPLQMKGELPITEKW